MSKISGEIYIISMIVVAVICLLVGYFVRKKISENKLITAETIAKKIIVEAEKEANNKKREAILEAKDRLYQSKAEFERETRDKKTELQKLEKRLTQKEENVERKVDLLDRKEQEINSKTKVVVAKERELNQKIAEYDAIIQEQKNQLQKISNMSSEEAKNMLIAKMENEAKHEAVRYIKKIEEEAKETAGKKSKEIISLAIQRYSADEVMEATVSTVELPNNEMKGRIIGREGRNIRALEMATGVDLIIDDTPEAVIISGYDPIRRQVAKKALEKLIVDGRIHPTRIEEIVTKCQKEIENLVREEGEKTTFEVGVHNLHPEEIKLIGRLRYRTSYGQNVLQHSKEVAFLAGIMAAELGIDEQLAKRAGLLHDIGKAVDHEMEGSHPQIGAELAKKYNESSMIINAIAAHHEDEEPRGIIAVLIQAADTLSAARPGARKESLENYVKRLGNLEKIGNSFKGVESSYAIQAGREIRIIIEPEKLSENNMGTLAKDIAKKIEEELEYPGQIKVTLIRESRTIEYAK